MRRPRGGRRRRPPSGASPAEGITIGDLEGPTAIVDEKGRIGALDGSWWLEWGGGADDRWHVAHEEAAVRQRRVDDAPVLETLMRVPGGDLVQRVAAVSDGRGRALVIEFENDSGAAVAVALVVRTGGRVAADPDGIVVEGGAVERDLLVHGDRAAGGVVASAVDPWPLVLEGPTAAPASVDATSTNGGATGGAALVVPVPHRQRASFTVVIEGKSPTRIVDCASVAAGWRAVAAGAAAIELPDGALVEAWRRVVPDLIIAAGAEDPRVAAEAAWYLDVAGLHDEADRARAIVVRATESGILRGEAAVAGMLALASRDLRVGVASGLADLVGPMAELAGDALTADVLAVIALALDTGSPDAADDARRLGVEHRSGWPVSCGRVSRGAEAVVGAVLGRIAPDRVDILPVFSPQWIGGKVDVRDLVTHGGTLSFSVRWHGERPALLWERSGGPPAMTIRAPGIHPAWSTTERSGETLLAGPAG